MPPAPAEWRQQHRNPHRSDGEWVKISQHKSGSFFGQLTVNGKKKCLSQRPTPALAAVDVDRVIYKVLGPVADTNGTLTPEAKAQLDGMTLEEVVAQIKATGGGAFSRGSSAYRGVSWGKVNQRWRASITPGPGLKPLCKPFDSELEAARQYDSWCKQFGKPLSSYNFAPDTAGQEAATGAAAAAAAPPNPPVPAAVATTAAPAPAMPPAAAPPPPRQAAVAAAGAAAVTAAAAAAAAPPGTAAAANPIPSSSSGWQQWLELEGAWWTDSSDEEEDCWEDDCWPQQQQQQDQEDGTQMQPAGPSSSSAAAAGPMHSTHSQGPSAAAADVPGCSMLAAPSAAPAAPTPSVPPSSTPAAGASLNATAVATAWHQLHGDKPLPAATMALFGVAPPTTQPSSQAGADQGGQQQQHEPAAGGSLLAAAAGAADAAAVVQVSGRAGGNSSSKQAAGQQQGCGLSPAVMAAAAATRAGMAQAWGQATGSGATAPQSGFVFGSSSSSGPSARGCKSSKKQGRKHRLATASSSAAAAAAAPAAPLSPPFSPSAAAAVEAVAVDSSPTNTHVTIECESFDLLGEQPLMITAAVARAAAAITHHPATISTADQAVAAAGAEPPEAAVDEIETALRTAALQSVTQLQPGGTHYWRGPAAWQYMDQHPVCMKTSASTTAAAAAEAGAAAPSPQAAADAALEAAHAAGRGCRLSDLHAAWLMQRLQAGVLRVTVQKPLVNMAVLEQALADHGVDVIPGLDFDPVPGLHPELPYPFPYPNSSTANTATPNAAATAADAAASMDVCPQPASAAGAAPPAQAAAVDWKAALAASEEAAAASAAYPYPTPADRTPFCAISSDDEEPYEAQWTADLIQGVNPFAAPPTGPQPPYGSSNSAAGARAGTAAAAAARMPKVFAPPGVECSFDLSTDEHREAHRQRVGFRPEDIPTIEVEWTGDEMADTMTFLKAVVAEGDADHLPSHVRAYRIGQLVKQKDPGFPLEHLMAMGRPIEGEYCPVVLGVPPPDPDAPAAAAAAAAAAAQGQRRPAAKARIENSFDPVNRRPPQALLLPGCSYSGQRAAARRATAAARAALLPGNEPAAAVGLAAEAAMAATAAGATAGAGQLSAPTQMDRMEALERISMVGGDKLVQQLRAVPHQQARAAGGALPAASNQQQHAGEDVDEMDADDPAAAAAAGSTGQDPSRARRRVVKAVRSSSGGTSSAQAAAPAATAAAAAAGASNSAAGQPSEEEEESVVAAAAAAAAAKLRALTRHNEGGAAAAAPAPNPQQRRAQPSNTPPPPAAATSGAGASSSRPATTQAAVSAHLARPPAGGQSHAERIGLLREMQRKARASLAAATSAPVIAAGAEAGALKAEDEHLECVHPSLLAAAAEAATEAATAALQPQPMDVDWNHPEDVAGVVGLWEPAEQQVNATYAAAQQAAKDRAAELAAAAAAGGAQGSGHLAGSAGAGSSKGASSMPTTQLAGNRSSSGGGGKTVRDAAYLQQQIGLMMGFVKADSCPAISAAEEAALGIKMPRPMAIVHTYSSAAPAAGAAAAAVAALVPGGGLVHSTAEEYPTAGSAGDVSRVSYGAAEREQQGLVGGLQRKVAALLKKQELLDATEAAFQAGGAEAAFGVMLSAEAEGQRLGVEDPHAWIDGFTEPTKEMQYIRAGGTGSWQAVRAGLKEYDRDRPTVAAAVELGLKMCAAATARKEQRLDAQEEEERLGGQPADPEALAAAAEGDVEAVIAAVLPRFLPQRARENALLAFRAATRMQAYLLGHDFPEEDPFDLYYEIRVPMGQAARDAFWERVLRGEVGQGQDGFRVAQPRVDNINRLGWYHALDGEEQIRVLQAELRWGDECRIVQEARRLQLHVMTAPGSLLHDIVLTGAGKTLEELGPDLLGETARHLIKTDPSERRQPTQAEQEARAREWDALEQRLAELVPQLRHLKRGG